MKSFLKKATAMLAAVVTAGTLFVIPASASSKDVDFFWNFGTNSNVQVYQTTPEAIKDNTSGVYINVKRAPYTYMGNYVRTISLHSDGAWHDDTSYTNLGAGNLPAVYAGTIGRIYNWIYERNGCRTWAAIDSTSTGMNWGEGWWMSGCWSPDSVGNDPYLN